jgi:KamA family protein
MTRQYKPYSLRNLREIPGISALPEENIFAIEVVAHVLPLKTNNYVVEELIDWDNVPFDPMFVLNFPQRGMLRPHHFNTMADLIKKGAGDNEIKETANSIRWQLNPHPAGQMDKNVPLFNGNRLNGIQHKYRETVLFFPSQGQTCHAYCSFCFRWPQFTGIDKLRFCSKEIDSLVQYIAVHKEVTDILFTGGDPLVMKSEILASYINRILEADLPHLQTIRIGTKSLSYWPYKFLDEDSSILLDAFKKVREQGKHLAIMAHFNHHRELSTQATKDAIERIKNTGAEIRTQSPLLKHINDAADVWAEMWNEQVRLSMIPYYMFVVRDTGAQHYFGMPLVSAWKIFKEAYQKVSGIARTVRGPSMSADPGKVQIVGVSEVWGKKVIVLNMLQGRNPEWVQKPFLAEYNETAIWLDDLKPAFSDKFHFEEDEFLLRQMLLIA